MKVIKLLSLFLLIALTLACTQKNDLDYLKDAERLLDAGQFNESLLAYKNALKQNANNYSARLGLGKLYLSNGLYKEAEKELNIAINLNEENNEALASLAEVMYFLRDFEDLLLLETDETTDFELLNKVSFYQMLASMQLGIDIAATSPNNLNGEKLHGSTFGQLKIGLLELHRMRIENAISQFQNVAKLEEAEPIAYLLLADAFAQLGDLKQSIASLETYLTFRPNDILIRLLKASLLTREGRFSEASEIASSLLPYLKDNPHLNYIIGLSYFDATDYENAFLHLNKANSLLINNPNAKLYEGIAAFQLEKLQRALQLLESVESTLPETHIGHLVLAITRLKLGYSENALSNIEDFKIKNLTEAELITKASYEFAKLGQLNSVKKLEAATDNVEFLTSDLLLKKGLLKLVIEPDKGIKEIEESHLNDPNNINIKNILMRAYLQSGHYDKGLQMAELWQSKQDLDGFTLAALIYSKLQQHESAMDTMRKALDIDSTAPYPLLYLAYAEQSKGNLRESNKILDSLLSKSPHFQPALHLMLRNYKAEEKVEELPDIVEEMIRQNDEKGPLLYFLSTVYIYLNEPKKVINTLERIDSKTYKSDLYWISFADSLIKLGKINESIEILNKGILNNQDNLLLHRKKIATLEKHFGNKEALVALNEAISSHVNDIGLHSLKIHFLVQENEIDDAKKALNNAFPGDDSSSSPIYLGLMGQILLAEGKPSKALPLLKAFYRKTPSNLNARYIFTALNMMEDEKEAYDFIEEHTHTVSKDINIMLTLASYYYDKDKKKALNLYTSVLELDNKNIMSLNNSAWILMEIGDLEAANIIISKALEFAPNSKTVIDSAKVIREKLSETDQNPIQ